MCTTMYGKTRRSFPFLNLGSLIFFCSLITLDVKLPILTAQENHLGTFQDTAMPGQHLKQMKLESLWEGGLTSIFSPLLPGNCNVQPGLRVPVQVSLPWIVGSFWYGISARNVLHWIWWLKLKTLHKDVLYCIILKKFL